MIAPAVSQAPKVLEAFRKGGGVPQADYPPEIFEAIERGSAPWYRHKLVRAWLPAMPQVQQVLDAGGSALDVGCGSGRAAIALALAFPRAQVHGYDNHPGSIERARANARLLRRERGSGQASASPITWGRLGPTRLIRR